MAVKTKKLTGGPELARKLGYTRARIWQLTRDGKIPAVVVGDRFYYEESTVRRLMRDGLPGEARPYRSVGEYGEHAKRRDDAEG